MILDRYHIILIIFVFCCFLTVVITVVEANLRLTTVTNTGKGIKGMEGVAHKEHVCATQTVNIISQLQCLVARCLGSVFSLLF